MQSLETLSDRLKFARKRKDVSQSELARLIGIRPQSIQALEQNAKARRSKYILDFADRLDVSPVWLQDGIEPMLPQVVDTDAKILSQSVAIRELKARVPYGGGDLATVDSIATWHLSPDWLAGELETDAANLRILTVGDDSMLSDPPRLRDLARGDKIIVDTNDREPESDALFIIYDGRRWIARRLEFIPFSAPAVYLIKPNSGYFESHEILESDLVIYGRVIGKWQRL